MSVGVSILNHKGFSLIEACLALIVIGLVALPVIHNYNVDQEKKKIGKTDQRNIEISYALGQFYNEFDRYPCPADLTLGPNDPSYGLEVCPGAPGSIPASQPATGKCTSGICRSYADGSTTETILYGGVPFRNLKLPVDVTLDSWSRKISYVVTERIANTNVVNANPPPSANGRAISYKKHEIVAGVEQTETSEYESQIFLISHGEDGTGGYTADGKLSSSPVIDLSTGEMVSPCNSQTSQAGLDTENCDNDGMFWKTEYGAKARGARHYDDIVLSIQLPPTYIWNPTEVDPQNAYASFNIGIGTTEVGVTLDDNGDVVREAPSPAYPLGKPVLYDTDGDNVTDITLDVVGTIRADEAKSDQLCSKDGSTCFNPADIGGSTLGIDCSSGSSATNANGAMVGIAGGSATCSTVLGPVASGGCAGGERITGFINGVAQCATVP